MISILGEEDNVVEVAVALRGLLDPTLVTSAELVAVSPDGVRSTWAATHTVTGAQDLLLSHQLASSLARGTWHVRPVLYTGSLVRVISIILRSFPMLVEPDTVPLP